MMGQCVMPTHLQEMERPNSAYLLVYERLMSNAAASTSAASAPQVSATCPLHKYVQASRCW